MSASRVERKTQYAGVDHRGMKTLAVIADASGFGTPMRRMTSFAVRSRRAATRRYAMWWEESMAWEQRAAHPDGHAAVRRGAKDQLAALERLWASGESGDAQADEAAWETLRRALNAARRAEGASLLFEDE